VNAIDALAFSGCRSLESIAIPESVKLLGKVFLHCHSLEAFRVMQNSRWPKHISAVDGVLFNMDQTALLDYPIGNKRTSYTIPAGVREIMPGTFEEAGNLVSITIPESVTSIGHNAFNNCWSLESVNIPSGVTVIEHNTFYDCRELKSIIIPHGVTTIGYSAFSGCYSLAEVVLPETVTEIGMGAFSCCRSLASEEISNICRD
jgi:hypothetical protein